jgi:DNA-binding XRE family transcriptional regulator
VSRSSVTADTSFVSASDALGASRLYALRAKTKESPEGRPRCVVCGAKLLLVRIGAGFSTCYRHDAEDPRHEVKRGRKFRSALKAWESRKDSEGKFEGCILPSGGALVREIRRSAHLSQVAFAKELGVSVATVYRWERGERGVHSATIEEARRVAEKERERWSN